ncbi:dihydropyrimidinase [Roseobacter sp. HKCCD9010]|uniref:dihydropyrimidinase n=1 Tax=unclassified Roseobacter TaxID=196798 RepID=UPI001492B0B7|nr:MULTISPECIES: dihydropyrimidinase [unclassified Roseobacter]MBF9049586.1 dihydropyrimidinase [Rhodobacterales bacterium HKCCD4356]NNV11586.1 dihydropyrimidinase [Roseobacter sp. HKCCD7357]NNV15770.1 dihydropyrimidinase [Roseobacter sp. HKCCD8768]NNV25230.1 dihydropyrimidinase [Roseobacter sp. HKCCD8192]NNV29487.1 dihydropyrimidinase [Roseobacter sp. HKCCD9061]
MSKVIKGGTIVTADRQFKADVLIEGEKIAEIGENLTGDEVIDAEGAHVIPGGIDPHTHLEMPFMGTTAAETFESGTFAAAAGGTTMLVDFCLPGEDGSLLTALDEWDRKSKDQICTDISYHMAITDWNESIFNEMEAVVKERGVNTFKHFMAYKGALMVEDDEMYASFKRCAELGALPLVHAENGDIVQELQNKYLAEGVTGPEGHAYSRPPEVEGEAANRAIMIADAAGTPLYIVHVSCEQAHEAIRRARQKGMRVYGEPLIQHLTLDETEYFNKDWQYAARRVMSPPFRSKDHQDSLWAGLSAGSLQVVATDHAAFTDEQKRMGLDNFTTIPNGTGGLEERMAMLWTRGVETGRLTPEEFVAVTSSNIAKILNIYPMKGALVPGADADVVVWDPTISKTVHVSTQKSIIDYNVFEGMEVTAQPRYTLSRGDVIWAYGQNSQPQPGRGRFVKRSPYASASKALSKWKSLNTPRKIERNPMNIPSGV